ncbi:MAG: choice-of-anchor J domain-containing protein [Bacteroidales bacterium]|nr:choice-of-anchor J domain-containing protein [Bacteroidales bacterium]
MKKVFLLLTMLLFAFTGIMKADELTVHDGSATNGYVPVYGYYADAFLKAEFVYPAEELADMDGADINGLTFYASQSSVDWGANYQVFMAEVADATISAYAGPDAGTVVYEGALSIVDGQMVVTFDTPYTYGGGNLLVGVYQTTLGTYLTSTWYGEQVTGASVQGYSYSSLDAITAGQKNFLPKTAFDYVIHGGASTTFTTIPEVLDLGYRPNGAWMAPYVFNMKSNVGAVSVNALDISGNYFTYNAELPATVNGNNPLEVAVSTGTAEAGEVSSTITVLYGENRDAAQFEITATAYDPVDGDVWENAVEVSAMENRTDYQTNMPAGIYHNYELPEGSEAADAVYKMTFANDVLLYAGVEHSADGELALYTEDFAGEGGPMADNNYVYVGPTVNPGPRALWWYYDYTGSNTWYGTSAGGGFYFGYKISTDLIAANDLAGLTITTVESAAREAYPYYCYIIEGGATPFDGDLIGRGAIENPEALYFFDINLEVPAYISGNDDIWVIFYSDSPYAAYCGRYPSDTNNGKIWTYNPNSSSPAWTSNVNYTPMIYARMLELPTGRTATMDLANMEVKKGNGVVSEIAEVEGNVMNVAKANMRNRDVQTLIEEGFEGGSMPTGWTQEGNGTWSVGTGDYSSSTGAATGTYNAKINHGTTGNNTYLITPAMDLSNATSATVSCNYINRSWAGDTDGFGVYYRVNGGAWNELMYTTSAHSTWTASGDITLTGLAANYEIGFKFYDSYGYGVGLDDVVVTADITSGGGGGGGYEPYVPSFTTMIDGMYVPAGTYYLVAASDVDEAVLSFAIADVPTPEPSIVIAPYDGETNVIAPYLAEWELGDYTTEMQVLVGTQYPPTTALIDWTDYLVESAFLMDLEPNQSYFMQVNGRNAAGTTMGEIVAFTTPIDPVEGLEVEEANLYPGDAAVFTWNANRTFLGYNFYIDGVKVNDEILTETTYTVEDLAYNMDGYACQVTAVYTAGESEKSEPVYVYMTGFGTVSGTAYDTDEEHPIPFALVEFIGTDEYGVTNSVVTEANENGQYETQVFAGVFAPYVITEGYDPTIQGDIVNVVYEGVYEGVNVITHEFYYPLQMIRATDETDDVLVEWAWTPAEMIVDFESGDFSQADFTLPAQYPWAITTTNPHEGTYCMKSTCEGVASGVSSIEATVEVPYYAKMGFWVRVSSESNYDKFHFYIDGVEQGQALSGQLAYQYKEYTVEAGVHTYKWEYAKDSSVNSNDDCVYVDDITMYMQDVPPQPIPGATVYDFDDDTMMGWTSVDADGDGNGWVSSANPGIYHNAGVSLSGTGHNASEAYVISGSYANQTGQALTPDNYLVSPTAISAQAGAAIEFYACAQDANYAAEHFGVAVSTTTPTAGAFTTIQEWTLTAKSMGTVDMRSDVRGTTAQGAWYQYTVDLSAYAGQDIWVAIRHFNCTDQFILNVDDITLGDGSAKGFDRAGDRSLVSYNLYRRNNIDEASVEDPELIAEGLASDVMSYVDNDWTTLPYGEWQWGIQATYEGYAPVPEATRTEVTYGFEADEEGWTSIDGDGDGNEWYNLNPDNNPNNIPGHNNSLGHMTSASYNGSALTPNNFLVSPEKAAYSEISFWACGQDASWAAEHFGVAVSTTGNTSASDFTTIQEWTMTAKGSGVASVGRDGQTRDQGAWYEYTVDLSAYAGQEIWVAIRHFNVSDMFRLNVDDITLTTGSAPVPPTPGPTGDGLSEIIWSNVLDKDMISTVTLNVVLNNGQAPVGAEVELTAIDFEEEYIMDETGTVVTELRKGEYIVEVELDGYTPFDGVLEITEDVEEYTFVLDEIIAPVADFYVSPTGWAMWEGATPTPGPTGDDSFEESFEGGLNGWNVLTVNTDGGEWLHSSQNLGGHDYTELAHTGTGFAMCYSFVDYVGAFNTDSYMYTPQKYDIVNGSTLTFFADNANDTYPENFSVVIATVDNPTAADFTEIWNGGAKGTGSDGAIVRHNDTRYENWRQHTIDLSAYAGQSVYIGFHDVNYDMYEIWIDDVTLSTGAKADRAPLSYKVFLEGEFVGETVYPFFQVPVEGLTEGEEYTVGVAPLYATGMGETMYATFTYAACSNYTGATNYAAAVNGNDVTLTWTLPDTPGPGPQPGGDTFTEDFEGGLNGWNVLTINADGGSWIHSDDNLGGYDYTGLAHSGTGFAMCYSFVDYVGSFNTDSYMYTPQMYTISNGSTLTFWADNANDSYPESFSVVISTAANPASAADFTTVWSGSAKGTASDGAMVRHNNNRYENWRSHTVDLSSYAGQTVYIGFHDVNYDMYEIWIDDVELGIANKGNRNRTVLYEAHFVTDPGAMANGADASWIKNGQSTWGPNINNGSGYKLADDFTLDAATTITEIEVYGYQTGSTTTSTFTGLYAQIYDGAPNAGGQAIWGDETSNIMTSTSFTNCYRGSDGETTATTRPLMAITAENLNIELEAGTYYLVWSLAGSASSGPWAGIEALPGVGNTGDGLQYGSSGWAALTDSGAGTPYGGAFKLVGEGGGPVPPIPGDILGVWIWRDGEPLTMAPVAGTTFVDNDVEAGEHDYAIRVVYSDYAMACEQIETVTVGGAPSCDPVTDLTAELYNYQGNDGALIQFTEPAGATSYKVYVDGELLGSISAQPIFINFEDTPDGNYEIGIVAVYANCESDMATTMFAWDAVAENDVVNAIYPNPTSSDLHINATAMTHVTVYNAMGQMVYDQEVSGDELILNMGQYETGVYMVKVTTETGSSVKRINVVK